MRLMPLCHAVKANAVAKTAPYRAARGGQGQNPPHYLTAAERAESKSR